MLDTLFVELSNPPFPVKLDDLPLNVIPLTRTSVTTCCRLPDDSSLSISRSQVEVHPNFAMTDYASQGKTRPYNVVDLSQACTHQSYYTTLSRSATAAGTLILNSIHPSKITGGASGALRQEFHELEVLDDITALQFNDKLPTKIAMADRRNTLIKLFIEWKGEKYMPSKIHPAIRWCKSDPGPFLESQDAMTSIQWRVVDSKVDPTNTVTCTVKSSSAPNIKIEESEIKMLPVSRLDSDVTGNGAPYTQGQASWLKRKGDNIIPTKKTQSTIKKVKFCHSTDTSASVQLNIPLGTQWQNNSCAYNAIITILFNMWSDPHPATTSLEDTPCSIFDALVKSFHSHESRQVQSGTPVFSLEQIRDFLRHRLARMSQEFTFGSYTSVQSLAEFLFSTQEIITTSHVFCSEGHNDGVIDRNHESSTSNYQIIILATTEMSLQAYMDNFKLELASRCATCNTHLMKSTSFVQTPALLAFDISNGSALSLDPVLWILCDNSLISYKL